MEALLTGIVSQVPFVLLLAIFGTTLVAVLRGANLLVDAGVSLSLSWGVPKMLIGATIVSIGTTLPETVVSVFAALRGAPGLALGNAVGSIIADTGLILGIAILIRPISVDRKLVARQNGIQFASALLLVLVTFPFADAASAFSAGGRLPRLVGVLFLGLLGGYLWLTIRWARRPGGEALDQAHLDQESPATPIQSLVRLVVGLALVVLGSWVLIPTVEEMALRLRVPDAIIAATLVAFGTSLPELITAVTAVRKGHGELALGNVIGADILNVLFVAGAAAAVTPGGLQVPPEFFFLFFPAMLFVVTLLRIGILRHKGSLARGFGGALLGAYVLTVIAGYVVPG